MKNKKTQGGGITASNLHKRLCPLYLSLASILSATADAATTPDTRQKNGPTMGQAANGTPVVNIADPNGKGISMNKFNEFNVDKQGMIFNNSMKDGVTKIGGYAVKNAQLQHEASAIISEVTGAKASYINGTMEVFGKKADIIIANENGISVNGATTINANSLTLSTGKVQAKDDGTFKLAVEKGAVSVTGQGINTDGLSFFDIVSRSAQLEGEIAGSADIKVLAGQNDYDLASRSHTVRSKGDGKGPAVAIDGSALGSMYGGKIQLISTESGAGVRHAGGIIASSDLDVNADGDIALASLSSDKNLTLSGKNITLNKSTAGVQAKSNVVLNALAGITLNSDVISFGGTIRIDASSLVQNAASLVTKNTSTTIPAIQINVAGEYTLSGKLQALDANGKVIAGGVVSLKNGDFVVKVSGVEVPFTSLISDAQVVSHSGDVQISAGKMNNNGGDILAKKGTLQFTLKDAFVNSGSVSATGDVTIASGSLKNSGILYASNNQTINVGSLDNEGRIFADKRLVMNASALNNKGNIGVTAGELQLTSTGDLTNSGSISGDNASVTINADGDVDNSGNIISNKKDVALTAKGKSVKNKGKIEGANVTLTASDANATLDNSGTVNAKQKVQVKTAKLSNSGGTLSAAGDMALNVSKELANTKGGQILANGTLSLDGAHTTTLKNEGEGWIQGKNVSLTNMASIDNTGNSVMLATGEMNLSGTRTLTNDGSGIQATTLLLDGLSTLNNVNDATLYSSGNLTIAHLDTLNNEASQIVTDGALALMDITTLSNAKNAAIVSGTGMTIDKVKTLTNSDSAVIQAGKTLSVTNVDTLNNRSDAALLASGNMTLDGVKAINNDSVILSDGSITLQNGNTLANNGVIQAGTDLILRHIKTVVNDGSDRVLMALRNLTIEDVDSLTNANGAVITAGMNAALNALGILSNLTGGVIQAVDGALTVVTDTLTNSGTDSAVVAGGNVTVTADNVTNENGAAIVSTDNNLTLNVAQNLNNASDSALAGGKTVALNVEKGAIKNTGNAVITGKNVIVKAKDLQNDLNAAINADRDLSLDVTSFNNNNGVIQAGNDLNLEVDNSLMLSDDNGDINARHALNITTHGDFINNTNVESVGNMTVNADGYFLNVKSIISAGDLTIKASDITNDGSSLLWTMGNMNLEARNGTVLNGYGGNILSMGDISIIANEIWNSAGIIRAEKDVNLDAKVLKNESTYTGDEVGVTGSQSAYAEYDTIENVMTKSNTRIAINMPIVTSGLKLDELAEISAGGNININQRDIYDNHEVTNVGGLIQAAKDITITGNLHNTPRYGEMSLYDYLQIPLEGDQYDRNFIAYEWKVASVHKGTWDFSTLYQFLDFEFGNGSAASKTGDEDTEKDIWYNAVVMQGNKSTLFNSMMTSIFGETWQTTGYGKMREQWAKVTASDGQALKDKKTYYVPQEKGEITAGGNFTHNGGVLDNGIDGSGEINSNANISDIDVGEYTVDTITPDFNVAVNTKTIDELAMGISPMPTIKDLVSLPGMFEISTDFKKTAEAEKNGTAYPGPKNNIVPIFETRPSMIDQNAYTGSDYFFDQVGYNPEEPVNVIGDNYFTSELIRREISSSVGSFFSIRDGLEGDALVQALMDNAGVAAKDNALGLVMGEPLSKDQMDNLNSDIVWYVNQTVNGVDVLVPVVYLCPETLRQMESGDVNGGTATVHAGGDMNVDADSINNTNGSISSGGNMTLVSDGDINNVSNGMNAGITSGGDISMSSTNGNINNNGAEIKADGDINMSAANGDINMTASVGHAENGEQVIHAFDDGVTAGGSISMEAKSITSNASNITAGKDVSMNATEGDVTFNDLHEIDAKRTIDNDVRNAFNFTLSDTQTTTGTAVGSNVTAGGNMDIHAKKDVVMEGGTYNAQTGSISAENDVTIKTSQDVAHEEEHSSSREFTLSAGANGSGQSVNTSYGTMSGGITETTQGDYVSPGSESDTSAIGKKPGRAPVSDLAGFNLEFNSTKDSSITDTKKNTNASINFDKSGSIEAGKTADIGGADLRAGDSLNISAEDVATTKYLDESKNTSTHKETTFGISGEVHSTVADTIDKSGNLIEKGTDGQSANAATTLAEIGGDVSNILLNDLGGASVTIGGSSTKSKSNTTSTAENINHISANNVSINTKKDTTLNGSDISGQNVEINAGGDVNMNAAKSTTSYTNTTDKHSGGITAGVGVDLSGVSGGASLDYSGSTETGTGNTTSYTNSTITGGDVKIKTGGDMTMTGANIDANTANVDVAGDMTINSVQDTKHTDNERANWGASVGVAISGKGVMPTGAVNAGGGSEAYDSSSTAKQSGINTTGQLDVKTGGDLNMAGANIISQDGTGSVDVAGNINAKTLDDSVEQDGLYGGGGVGIGGVPGKKGGIPSGNIYVDTVDEIHRNETQKSTISVGDVTSKGTTGEINTNKDEMSVVTRDEKEAGNNISYTLADPGFGKKSKGSYDVDTPDTKHHGDTDNHKPADSTKHKDTTPSQRTFSEDVPVVTPSKAGDLKPAPKPADSTKKTDTIPSDIAHSTDVPAVTPSKAGDLKPAPKPADSTKKTDTTPSDIAHSTDVPAVTPSKAGDLKPAPKPADSTKKTDTTPSDIAHSTDVPAVTPSKAGDLKPAPKPADSTTPKKKWDVPNTNYPTLSPGSATGKTGKDMPKTPEHRKWNGDMTNGVAPSSSTSGTGVILSPGSSTGKTGMDMPKTPEHKKWNGDMTHGVAPSSSASGTGVILSPGSSTGKTGMDMPKTPEHKQWNGDMTNGVAPSSSTSGTDVKLSPGSATGQTGMDMPKTPEHKQWNGDMTNGVAPSSSTSGTDVILSPGSSTGKTGMDMPKTPEHKMWNGNMNSTGAMTQPKKWLPLMQETPIDMYAKVIIEFKKEQLS